MNDYLWDRSGAPDEEIVRLESLLGAHAHHGTLAPLPPLAARRSTAARIVAALCAAASIALVAAAAYVARTERAGWGVEAIAGAPRVSGEIVDGRARLMVGDALTTGADARAKLDIGDIGEVDVDPNSRLRLLRARPGEHRMALDAGTIHARIWAPPRNFYVNTPAATAVDLGCAYTLEVDARGWGLVRVESGWVSFVDDGREAFIPKGAVCAVRPGFGPGTPHYADAPAALGDALSILDFTSTENVNRGPALGAVLDAARPRDALTLWHLLARGSAADRARVYDRLAAFVQPPPGVTRDRVLRGDRRALDDWWNALGLDSASWWRLWTRPWGDR